MIKESERPAIKNDEFYRKEIAVLNKQLYESYIKQRELQEYNALLKAKIAELEASLTR